MQIEGKQIETEQTAKCHYKKPSLAAVILVADQALADPTCKTNEPCTNPAGFVSV